MGNHWCVLRSAQTMSKKVGDFFFPRPLPLILDIINSGVCHLWLLLLDWSPTCALYQLSPFVGASVFFFTPMLCLIEASPPGISAAALENIFSLLHPAKRRSQWEGLCDVHG